MFSAVNVYLDHLKFCVVCIDVRRYVCCSECNVVSNECNEPTCGLVQPTGTHGGEVMYFRCVCFRGELDFLNCDDICMCVVNKHFVFDFVYVDLQYDEILSLLLLGLCPCVVSVVVFGLSVRLLWYPMWMRVLLFVLHVCLLRECDCARLTAMLVWGMDEVW